MGSVSSRRAREPVPQPPPPCESSEKAASVKHKAGPPRTGTCPGLGPPAPERRDHMSVAPRCGLHCRGRLAGSSQLDLFPL